MAGTTEIPTQSLQEWRASMFEEIGFNKDQAEILSDHRDDQGWLISYANVEEMLHKGCSIELAMRILL